MENTKRIGNLVELQCATRLYELGCSVSIPFGNSEKYDLIIDFNNQLYKIQCKHCSEIVENEIVIGIKFKTTWQSHNSSSWSRHKYNEDEIDYFATFYNDECYLVPVSECSTSKSLRIIPTKSGQVKGISFLKDYSAKEVIKSL